MASKKNQDTVDKVKAPKAAKKTVTKKQKELAGICLGLLAGYELGEIMLTLHTALKVQIEATGEEETQLQKRQLRALHTGASLMNPKHDQDRILMIKPEPPTLIPPIAW